MTHVDPFVPSDRFSDWDAAYVLGALSPAERREYEEHLATCSECSRSVAEFAAMPGLLAALPKEEAFGLLDDEVSSAGEPDPQDPAGQSTRPVALRRAPAPDFLPTLAEHVRRRRRRRVGSVLAGSLAAAALVVSALVIPPIVSQPRPTSEISLQQVVPSALTAKVAFTSKTWGTLIDMTCIYGGSAAGSGSTDESSWDYGLYVVDRSGKVTQVSTWTADPGQDTQTTGSIDTALSDLTRVEVRNESSGTVLLSSTLHP